MKASPRDNLLKFLSRNDFATLREAQAFGVSKMTLSHLVREGVLYRPAKRIYTTKTDWLADPLRRYAPACTLYPDAVVCGVSALAYYDLTDEEEKKVWLAFPQSHRVVNQEYRLIYPRGLSYTLGVTRHNVGKREVRIYNPEKSVVDAFKYLPIDVAHKALRAYLKRKEKNLDMLTKYARQLRKPLDDILVVLLSDE
ncbi:MAG: type IV toxin-antitoxin system AbiEi family antitoxin domain-containing protein [Pseudomonadota bacterium]